eukprot:g16047.t1
MQNDALIHSYCQVIGTGDDGSSPCLLVSVEKAPRYSGGELTENKILRRYLFNVGEGTQRFCGEAGVKLAKLNKVFLTGTGAEEHAGLSGLVLTLSALCSPALEVFGPAGVDKLVEGLHAFGPRVGKCPIVSPMPLPLGPGESQCSYVLGDEHMEVRCGVVDPARRGPAEEVRSVDSSSSGESSGDSSSSSSSSSSEEEGSGSDEESSDDSGSSDDGSDEGETSARVVNLTARTAAVPAGVPARGPAVLYRCRVLYGAGSTFLVLSCPNVSYVPAVRDHAIVRGARGKDSVLFVFHLSPEDVVEEAAYAPLLALKGTHVLLGYGSRGRARGAGGLQHYKLAERSVQLNFVAPQAFPLHSALKNAGVLLTSGGDATSDDGVGLLSEEGRGNGGGDGGGGGSREVVGHTLSKAVLLPASVRGIDLSAVRPPVEIDEIREDMEQRLEEAGLRHERDRIVEQLCGASELVSESALPPYETGEEDECAGSSGCFAGFPGMRESSLPPIDPGPDPRASVSSGAPQARLSSFLPPPPPPPPMRSDRPGKRARTASGNNGRPSPHHFSTPRQPPPTPPYPPEPPSLFSAGGMAGVEVFFLGTGSAAPTKNRGCSGILLRIPQNVSVGRHGGPIDGKGKPLRLLIDAGEGTLGHLERQFGREGALREIRGLDCVWVSHKHADHHTGLFRLIAEHHRAREASRLEAERGGSRGTTPAPLVVVAPSAVLTFIRACKEFSGEEISYQAMQCKEIERGGDWQGGPPAGERGWGGKNKRVSVLLDGMRSVPVFHCREAYGLVVQLRKGGAKLVYSGDTRPCDGLVRAGAGASLLIHEATFDDSMQQDAISKFHCTTSEALEVGRRMRAREVVLTHFSQRYPRVPVLDTARTQRFCVAFDGMVLNSVTVGALPAAANVLSQLLEPKAEEGEEGVQEEIILA